MIKKDLAISLKKAIKYQCQCKNLLFSIKVLHDAKYAQMQYTNIKHTLIRENVHTLNATNMCGYYYYNYRYN